MSPLHKKVIVFGASGAIGNGLVEILSKEQPSWEVTAVSRKSPENFSTLSNVTVVPCDATNKQDVLRLTADKDIVYTCIGFPKYEKKFWAKTWPVVVDNMIEATSQKGGQKLVFCDNLYAYGAPSTKINPNTTTPLPPNLKSKPGIRSLLRQKFEQRMKDKPESIVVVGCADFFGPNVTENSFLGDTFTKAIIEGKKAPIAIGSASKIHDFGFSTDFSYAMYITSINDAANGKFWVCPHSIKGKSMNEIAQDIADLVNKDKEGTKKQVTVTTFPSWSIKMLSPFMGFMKEMIEMLPIWINNYQVDDSDFCQTFGVEATPYEDALQTYIDFYRQIV